MMTPDPEAVLLHMNIQKRRNGVDFYVMQTPLPLWDALPQKPKLVSVDYSNQAHYFKLFTLKVRGKSYEFTFYRTESR